MKIFKQISALLLSAMILCTTSNVAYAAEMPIDTETVIASYDFELMPDMREGEIALMANVDNTFNVYGSHTGSTRNYYGNKLKYTVTITDANGVLHFPLTILRIVAELIPALFAKVLMFILFTFNNSFIRFVIASESVIKNLLCSSILKNLY